MNKHIYSHSKIFVTIALLFCLFHTHVYGYLSSVRSWQKNNQKVLVLGDNHTACPADARDKVIVTNLFTYCAERQNPTQVLFEQIPYTHYLLTDENQKLFDQYTHKNYMPLAGYISQYALWCNHAYKSLRFSPSDLRYSSESLKFLTVVRIALFQYLEQNIKNKNTNIYNQFLTPEQKTELLSLITRMLEQSSINPQNDCSYQDIAIALDSLVSYCTHVQKSLSSNNIVNELIARLSHKIQNFSNQLKDFSMRFTASSVLASVNASIEESKTPRDLETLLELYKPLIEEIADLGFIKELLDTLAYNNTIILYTGAWHSTAINKVLQALEFTCTHTLMHLPQEPTISTQQRLFTIIEEFVQ